MKLLSSRTLGLLSPVALVLALLLLIPEAAPVVFAQPVQPEGWVELVEERTRTGKSFFDPSRPGAGLVNISMAKVHYDGPDWKDIDNSLVPSLANVPTLGLADLEMTTDDYEFYALQTLNTIPLWLYRNKSLPDSYISFIPQGLGWTNDLDDVDLISMPQSIAGVVTENRLEWKNAYGPGVNLTLSAQSGRLAKVLTLNAMPPAPAQYILDGGNPVLELRFIFRTPSGPNAPTIFVDGIEWDQSARTETVGVIDFRMDGETIFSFAEPTAFDFEGAIASPSFILTKQGPNLRVAIRVPLSFLETAVYPVVIDPTIDEQVGVNLDDGYSTTIDGFDTNFIRVGNISAAHSRDAFMRFTTVAIPAARSSIDVAYLTVQAVTSGTDGAGTRTNLYGDDTDSASAPVSRATHEAKVRTTAFVAWDDEDLTVDVDTNSPSIVSVITEITGRGGWSSGNSLQILWDNDASDLTKRYAVYDYNDDTAKAVKLHVEYSIFENFAPIITNPLFADSGETFTAYSQTFLATDANSNQTLTWTLITDASFLAVDSQNRSGFVNGTPGSPGLFFVNVSASDGSLSDFSNYTLEIRERGSLTDTQTMIIWLSTILMLVLFLVGPVFRMWFLWMLAGIDGILFGLFVFNALANFPLAIIIMGFGGFLLVGGILLTISQAVRGAVAGREV